MNSFLKYKLSIIIIILVSVNVSCQTTRHGTDSKIKKEKSNKKKVKLSKIDLSHWKVTIPKGTGKGGAISVEPPEIMDYSTNETLMPYMYNDSTNGALVFYANPTSATTANSKYSRSELREQMVPGDDNINWTFKQGGILQAKLAVDEVTRDENGKFHKVIILQIHGRLTDEQRDIIGQKDNNAPPVLKIYWQNGKIRVKTKKLKYTGVDAKGILHEEAWTDDEGFNFKEEVGFRKFKIEIKVTDGKMVVSLNKNEFATYDDINIKRWGIFENYFKAGNYFQSRDEDSFAKINFYELEVFH